MSPEKTTLEIIAPTVDEAVARGLGQLGLSREQVDVEVLDSGSRGVFGLGSRQARVRLTLRASGQPIEFDEEVEEEPQIPVASATPVRPTSSANLLDDDEFILHTSREVVGELLERMKIQARVNARFVQPADEKDQRLVMVDVKGDDLSILIGRRSETLNALQYIASLIVCKEVGHWVALLIDVQGYRERRDRQLRQIARRMAEQAVQSGRRQVLEPMPANERRIIHLELRDHPNVITESSGEEPNRKVTITLKKEQ